jgi:hypothetical protein
MMILGSKREEMINNLNFTAPLRKLTNGEYVHDELEFRCLELKYALETDDFSPNNVDLVPLWESDTSITGFYMNEEKPVFVHYYIEDIADLKTIGTSVEDLVAYLVSEYVDYDYEAEVKKLLLGK